METQFINIGILGGGQLGKMLIESFDTIYINSAKTPRIYVLDPSFDCPCAKMPEVNFMQGSLYDEETLKRFATYCDVITYEIEHLNADVLIDLETRGKTIYPSPKMLKIIQNKYDQKQWYESHGFPVIPYSKTNNEEDFNSDWNGHEIVVLKALEGGYDGRGVKIIEDDGDMMSQFSDFSKGKDVLVETYVDNKTELSVLVSRDQFGTVNVWSVVEMAFDEIHNILDYMFSPSQLPADVQIKARELGEQIITKFDAVGVFAIEMFYMHAPCNKLYINEIAPRPHNSAHHTIHAKNSDGTSVYETLAQILCGNGNDANQNDGCCHFALMKNVLGSFNGRYKFNAKGMQNWEGVEYRIVDYNKTISKPQRKLGHITFIAKTQKARENFKENCLEMFNKFRINRVSTPLVGIVMGSTSDWPTMVQACDILDTLGIRYEKLVVSAHRTPERLVEYAQTAHQRYVGVIIAGAGGAAHLPGMLASLTHIPVIGVPVKTSTLSGMDSLYSIVQMPPGVPVATVAIGGAKNAGLLAAQILSLCESSITQRIINYKKELKDQVTFSANKLN